MLSIKFSLVSRGQIIARLAVGTFYASISLRKIGSSIFIILLIIFLRENSFFFFFSFLLIKTFFILLSSFVFASFYFPVLVAVPRLLCIFFNDLFICSFQILQIHHSFMYNACHIWKKINYNYSSLKILFLNGAVLLEQQGTNIKENNEDF